MESETTLALLESYRTDRRELLKYILATNGGNVVTPPGVTSLDEIDYDNINVKYVLHRASKGLSLEIADALVHNSSTQEPDISSRTVSSAASHEVANLPTEIISDPEKREDKWNINVDELQLSLPVFETGLSDDDIRETAYEVLLASVGAAGGLVLPTKDKKEESVSKVGKWKPHSNNTSGLAGLMNIMRVQLQITEEVEKRTTEAIFHASNGRLGKRIDSLLLPLELLCNITREEFSNPNIYPSWQKRQLNIIKEGFLNNPHWNLDPSDHLATELLKSASSIENLAASRSSKPRGDALRRIRDVCLAISERSGKTEELCHWADGYYLNVRLYEKLLFGIFQSSECNRFIEEIEEVLELLKSTWRVMGITQTVHDTCYTWVLFKQFVFTGDFVLLQHAARQIKKIAPDRQRSAVERAYLKNLRTSNGRNGSLGLSYVQSVLIPIKSWIDKQLQDYHQNFLHDRTKMEALLAIAMTCARLLVEEEATVQKTPGTSPSVLEQVEDYVSSSIKQAYAKVLAAVDENAVHRLVSLAEAVKKLAETDVSYFSPLLSRWGPLSVAVTASVLHTCYYKDLKPVLEKLSLLKDGEVTAILSAADDVEQYLQDLIASVDTADERLNVYKGQMTPYEVETISGNLSMRCTATKLEELSKHVETVFGDENWEPLSAEQRYGRSALDLFQNISKVVDNFFSKELPIRISHLKGLTDGLNDVIQAYSRKLLTQLGDKADLIPPAPALTRYKKELSLKSLAKKKVIDPRLPDEKRSNELKAFSTPKLCVRLNTLHFVLNQLELLETSIKQRWSEKRPQYTTRKQNLKSKQSEEIFPGFDSSKKFVAWALEQTCEFTGFKLIFWDMREVYVDTLYKGGVTQCRIEKVVNGLDSVLGQLCEVLIEPLRDQVVYGLLEASLEGFLWVLLDGGPSRSFSQGDADILEQDLNVLKEFFVADGDGLPKGVVDNAAAQVHQILNLYRMETHSVVENFKRASEQATNPTRSVALVPDSEILLRVLCHRKDKDAAKFLKHYKLPKH